VIKVDDFKTGDKVSISLGMRDAIFNNLYNDLTPRFTATTTAAVFTTANLTYTCKGLSICLSSQTKSSYDAMKITGQGNSGVDWNIQYNKALNSEITNIILR